MSDVFYRPPLWSQMSSYSAADDRRLIMSTLHNGVIELSGLKVEPRQTGGPGMAVDVLPGHVVVEGQESSDQGTYLCALAQRVTIPINAGPSAGNHRRTIVYAKVIEPVGQPATWEIVPVDGAAVPTTNPNPPAGTPTGGSFTGLAQIVPIGNGTTQITSGLLYDFRHFARPASMGSSLLYQTQLPQVDPGTAVQRWGQEVIILTPPLGLPIDIECRLEGKVNSVDMNLAPGITQVLLMAAPPGAGWTHQLPQASATSLRADLPNWFSRTLVARNVTLAFPAQIYAEAQIQRGNVAYSQPRFSDGTLTVRVSPSGSGLSW
jgi:hypothetical protein